MKKFRKDARISVAAIAALIIVILIMVSMCLLGGWIQGPEPDVEAYIDPGIYAPNHNIGVLNEEAVFNIVIKNNLNHTTEVTVIVGEEDDVLVNKTVNMEPESSRDLSLTQKLISTGLWTIRVLDEHERVVESYSFVSVINDVEADMKINQRHDIQFNKNLAILATTISALSLFVSMVVAIYTRKQNTKGVKKDARFISLHLLLEILPSFMHACRIH